MKTILLLIILNTPVDSNFTEVVYVDSCSQSELYTLAKKWFSTSFKSSNDAIQYEDGKEIIGKGVSKINFTFKYKGGTGESTVNLHYTITIQVKDSKYKYSITNIYTSSSAGETSWQTHLYTNNSAILEPAIKELNDIISSIKTYIYPSKEEW